MFNLAPIACAQSSITIRLFFFAIFIILFILQALPAKCTGIIPFVFELIFLIIDSLEIFIESISTSASTGVAPACSTAFAVATNVISGIIISSPFPILNALRDKNNADVAFETPIAYFAPVKDANSFSNFSKIGPSVNSELSKASMIDFLSSLVIHGLKKGTSILFFCEYLFFITYLLFKFRILTIWNYFNFLY